MRRSGFSIVPVLWVVVVLGATVLLRAQTTGLEARAARNRQLLLAAEWAREGCLNVLHARLEAIRRDSTLQHTDRATLVVRSLTMPRMRVRGTASCDIAVRDLGAYLNVNTADSATLACVAGSDAIAAAILKWRPIPSDDALHALISSVGEAEADTPGLSVRADERVNLNSAPVRLMECMPKLGKAVAMVVAATRRAGRKIDSPADIALLLPSPAREDFVHRLAMTGIGAEVVPPTLALVASGYAGSPPVHARLILTVRVRGTAVDVLSTELES
ncbi:MAG: hypothetical protein IPK33_18500 [Gemmatimonadetes bacterium]|nr:hypothetical protein [Gemmatimonadota bacterium]